MKRRYYEVVAVKVPVGPQGDEKGAPLQLTFTTHTTKTGGEDLLPAIFKAALLRCGVAKGMAVGVLTYREVEAPIDADGDGGITDLFNLFSGSGQSA